MAETKVVYATQDLSLHRKTGQEKVAGNDFFYVEGLVVRTGETVPLDDLPPYQQEAVKAGKVAGAEVLTEAEAAKRGEELAKLRDLVAAEGNTRHKRSGYTGPDAQDGSHSDHEVSDEDRRAQHDAINDGADTPEAASGGKK